MKRARLILMRHGQSVYNQKNIFTGWSDVALTAQGIQEAKAAGEILLKHHLYPDVCFTSWLKRAIHTAQVALQELGWEHIDSYRSYRLNERHYGAWQGQEKEKIKEQYGEEAFLAVRRGYDTAPPPLAPDDKRAVKNDPKYAHIQEDLLPLGESLKDTKERVIPYYQEEIKQHLLQNKTVLISAHGNSLRALAMHIEGMSQEAITHFEIPTGEIIIYTFDATLKGSKKEILKGNL